MRASFLHLLIISLLLTTLLFSGCISTNPPASTSPHKIITRVHLYNSHLNYSEIMMINKTNLSDGLESVGYTIENYNVYFNFSFYASIYNYTQYPDWTSKDTIAHIRLDAYTQNESKFTQFSFDYYPDATGNLQGRNNETLAKQYVTEKSNEFAQIANITIPWEFAEWSTTYAD